MSLPPGRCSSGGVFTHPDWSSVFIAALELVYMMWLDATPARPLTLTSSGHVRNALLKSV